jgi:hypothetical protein
LLYESHTIFFYNQETNKIWTQISYRELHVLSHEENYFDIETELKYSCGGDSSEKYQRRLKKDFTCSHILKKIEL